MMYKATTSEFWFWPFQNGMEFWGTVGGTTGDRQASANRDEHTLPTSASGSRGFYCSDNNRVVYTHASTPRPGDIHVRIMRSRLHFMDNLRYLGEWSVVIFHTAVGYALLAEFFIEPETSPSLLIVRHAVVVFTLPLLCMVAGYFTIPSIRSHGTRGYLGARFRQLGIPFLVGIVLLGPLMPYLGYYSQSFRSLGSDSYWTFWVNYIGSGFEQWVSPAIFTTQPRFHQQHFYFLPMLLEIIVLYVAGRWAWLHWRPAVTDAERPARRPNITLAFMVLALALPLAHYFAVQLPGAAGAVAVIFYFSLSDFILLGGSFALGIFAFSRGWFREGNWPGWPLFLTMAVLFLVAQHGGDLLHVFRPLHTPDALKIETALSSSIVTWFTVALLFLLAGKLLNRTSAFSREMAASSFDIYLLQYPVILALRLPLMDWNAPALLKFSLVVPLTVLICWFLSARLIRPHPRLAVALLLILSLMFFMTGPPRWGDSHLLLDRRPALLEVIAEPEGGQAIGYVRPADLPELNSDKAVLSIVWVESGLQIGDSRGGLSRMMNDGGEWITAWSNLAITDLEPGWGGTLIAINAGTREIVQLDPETGDSKVLMQAPQSDETPGYLAVTSQRRIYFTASSQTGSAALYVRAADGSVRQLDVPETLRVPNGVALDAESKTLYLNDAEGLGLWSATLETDGTLHSWRRFGEIFRGDRHYGEERNQAIESHAHGMAIDQAGYLYLASRPGVQVFEPSGRLLGLASFPELLSEGYYPPEPQRVAVGGPDGRTLFVSCADRVYTFILGPAPKQPLNQTN